MEQQPMKFHHWWRNKQRGIWQLRVGRRVSFHFNYARGYSFTFQVVNEKRRSDER